MPTWTRYAIETISGIIGFGLLIHETNFFVGVAVLLILYGNSIGRSDSTQDATLLERFK